MGQNHPVQARLVSILAIANRPDMNRAPAQSTAVLRVALILAMLSFICVCPVDAQVKQVSPLLDEARQVAMDLHQLPVGDDRASQLLTHGLELLQLADKLVDDHLDQLGAAQGPLSKQDRNLTRLQQARIAYVTGEMYRLTAMKRTSDDPTRRAYLDSAVIIFSEMRSKFASIQDAELARVGLARCYRLLGELDNASKIIEPLLRQIPDRADASASNLWRAAVIESLEILLDTEPDKAMTQAIKWIDHPSFVSQTSWLRSLKRIEALAAVALAMDNPKAPQVLLAVDRLRESDLPAAVQLQYMVQLELASNIPVVSPQQRNDWVLLLVDTLDAKQAVDRIKAQVPDPSVLNVRALMVYGSALWQAGELPVAVDCFARAMRMIDDVDPLKHTAARWYAQCLYQQVITTDNPSIRIRARAALSRLVQTHPSRAARLEALKQWVSLEQSDEGLASAATVIAQHRDLGGDDVYLYYITASNQWEQLKEAVSSGRIKSDASVTVARELLDQTARQTSLAIKHDKQIAGGLLQLQARMCASQMIQEPTRAMTLLDEAEQLLGESQLQLRTLFLIQADQPDQLWELLKDTHGDAALSSQAWTLIVDSLTELALRRGGDVLLVERASELAIKAWNASPSTAERIRIAQALVKLNKWELCLTLLGPDLIAETHPQLNLIIGQALLGQGQDIDHAAKVLEHVVKQMPDSSDAHLWLALAYARSQRNQQAAEHFRRVRTLQKPATVTWWQATLGLAQALTAMGQNQAARQILQVTLTLYPVIGDDALANQLVELLGRLQKP
tara:strand:+ start:285 stop:2654 length:2370 start_codon:yes stop_codon:yes gene_type:complete